MSNMPAVRRRDWSEQELTQVLSLYCQLEFGKMHSRNPAVIALARALDRTASAVALKLVNFASFDPSLQSRGVRGMSNASRRDRQIWDAHYAEWETLATMTVAEHAADAQWSDRITSTERVATVRIGQGFFRNAVLSAYQGRCCITAITEPALLRASHIIPWSVAADRRLDPANGLCLNAIHDAAFDQGLITVTSELKVAVSPELRDQMPDGVYAHWFGCYDGKQIQLPERYLPGLDTLRYHFENVFRR